LSYFTHWSWLLPKQARLGWQHERGKREFAEKPGIRKAAIHKVLLERGYRVVRLRFTTCQRSKSQDKPRTAGRGFSHLVLMDDCNQFSEQNQEGLAATTEQYLLKPEAS
jgi:hypothetical protein